MLECGVTIRFKMLAYYRVRSAFESNRALPSNMIRTFANTLHIFFNRGLSEILK
jgi:hypothetical protein